MNHGRIPRSSMRWLICKEQRQLRASSELADVQFHDRSAMCTAALAAYLGHPFSHGLSRELERIKTEAIFQKRVFFIRNLGFITPTEARRISFEETLRFERIHEETYRSFGFEIVSVEPGKFVGPCGRNQGRNLIRVRPIYPSSLVMMKSGFISKLLKCGRSRAVL